jgi:N-methylhydantoinase A
MLEASTRTALEEVITARGYDPSSYICLAYGGSGPLHVAGYTRGLDFKAVMTFQFAAAFSAFGCTTADFLHRYASSTRITLGPEPTSDELREADEQVTAVWERLERQAQMEFGDEGAQVESLRFERFAMMRYAVQLDDLEITLPDSQGESPAGSLIARFEDLYERINRRVAKYRRGGYAIMEIGLFARIPTPKPSFPRHELGSAAPSRAASKGEREVYVDGGWRTARIWEMDELRPGNVIGGLSIVEHSMTTLVIPADMRVEMDERGFLWLMEDAP